MMSTEEPKRSQKTPNRRASSWLRGLLTLCKFAVPAVILGVLLWQIPEQQWTQIAQHPKNYTLLSAAVAVAVLAIATSFVRWCLLVRCQQIELSMLEAFRLGAIGYLLSFVSAGSVGGDVFKAVFLARRRPGHRVAALASVMVDRGCGLYGLLLMAAGVLLFVDTDQVPLDSDIALDQVRWATWTLVGLGTLVVATLILGGRWIDGWIQTASQWPLVGGLVARIGPPIRCFHSRPLSFLVAVLMSVAVQTLLVISMFLIARGMIADPPSLAEHFVIVPVGMLVSALPLSPAGAGLLEAAIATMYGIFDGKDAIASGTVVALVFELVKVSVAAIGVVFYMTAPAEVTESMKAENAID
ncbi:MAG: lysylphosphatidylglycerol synthase transmembrane domain-containing protein [Planctomycetota bacterium]